METKNMIGTIVSLAVVVICVATIMMPVISDAQYSMGTEHTFTNTTTASAMNYELWDGEDIRFRFVYTSHSTFSIDSEDVTSYVLADNGQNIVLASNVFAARTAGSASSPTLNAQYLTDATGWTASFIFEVTDGVYTLTKDGNVVGTGTLEWLVYATQDGTMNIAQLASSARESFYTSDSDNLIVLGNIYTTGDNDTFYSYYNGDLTVNSTYENDSSVAITRTQIANYLDVYTTSLVVNVGDESFTPYYILAPVNVTGTAESQYNALLVALPIIVIVGIVIATISTMVMRRD